MITTKHTTCRKNHFPKAACAIVQAQVFGAWKVLVA